ncbi:rod shape-determining protein MreD [Luteirhabdus pelagi]|uniref:rod shape-determining protein MreD n=1 Tax=Luteirhabdus pelagi TaxID=2792783 RepID=UPI001939E8EF|nr:rod shape-determining protein MreD [Luteirhabdus pelagi]
MLNNDFFINTVRFIALVLLQILLLNNINFMGYINPYAYITFILVFPLNANKSLLIFLAFLLGLTIDMFMDSGGVHAAACSFIAYIRPWILKFSFGVSYEHNTIRIGKTSMAQRFSYVGVMVLLHHFILFSLEIFSLEHILLIVKSTLFSGIFTILIVLGLIILFSRKN